VGRIKWQSEMTCPVSAASFMRKQRFLNVRWDNYEERKKTLFRVRLSDTKSNEILCWCEERFGDEWIWSNPVQTSYIDIFFLKEEDALLLKLSFDTVQENA
jgi:hypothetical protein